jgi:hypothetical protein
MKDDGSISYAHRKRLENKSTRHKQITDRPHFNYNCHDHNPWPAPYCPLLSFYAQRLPGPSCPLPSRLNALGVSSENIFPRRYLIRRAGLIQQTVQIVASLRSHDLSLFVGRHMGTQCLVRRFMTSDTTESTRARVENAIDQNCFRYS